MMGQRIPFSYSYLDLPERFYTCQSAAPAPAARLVAFNDRLAAELGFEGLTPQEATALFSGGQLPDTARPFAQVYAGHQFGGFSPQLGDGRALMLGELETATGRVDVQLKGSGPTPYSRRGDGRAWVGPVLREYLMSCFMDAMGVPTTRALAAVTTGAPVLREQGPLPGAILTRVASSHIRVGTFQFFAARGDLDGLQALFDYTVARHAPHAQTPDALLAHVVQTQASLVAKWMGLGFIHGVMNTDNVAISGETIDYGPCAMMDVYHPDRVFSSIDRQGRYAYSSQPAVTHWNLAQFATALVPLMPDQDKAIEGFTRIINTFPDVFNASREQVFAAKLGLPVGTGAAQIADDLLMVMADQKLDFTTTFHRLDAMEHHAPDWFAHWRGCRPDDALWRQHNPAVVPRLHLIEAVIQAALRDDYGPFETLLDAVSNPFDPEEAFMTPPAPDEQVLRTFCGT